MTPLSLGEGPLLTVCAPDAGHPEPHLLGVRAPGAGAGELFPPLQDGVAGDHCVEGGRVGDQEAGPLLDGDTGPHLQPLVRSEDEATVRDTAVIEESHPGVQAGEVMGGAGGEHLECVGVEDAEDGQHHLLLGQVGEQGAELGRLPLGLLKLWLILSELDICGELPALLVPGYEECLSL